LGTRLKALRVGCREVRDEVHQERKTARGECGDVRKRESVCVCVRGRREEVEGKRREVLCTEAVGAWGRKVLLPLPGEGARPSRSLPALDSSDSMGAVCLLFGYNEFWGPSKGARMK
jgi:hypothetical protein